jgi:hypothetical protein
MKTNWVVPCLAAAFLVCLAFFFDVELSPGVASEGTDWAMYVMHARNIVSGAPYSQTGYVFQAESTTEVGGYSYPSGYSLMIAPLYAAEGLNIRLFKLLNAGFLVISLWPAYLFARKTLSPVCSLVLIVSLGFSWLFLANFNAIGSDAPYELVSLLVLLLLLRIYEQRLNETDPWTWGLWAGLSIAAAYLIRPIGLTFLLSVGGVELWYKRRITAFLVAAATAFVPLMLLNNFLFHSDGGYVQQFTFSVPTIAHHALEYGGFFSYVFANPVSKFYRYILWAVTLIPVTFGIVKRVRAGLSVTELYVLTLLAVDSVYWSTNARYLLPIMPIYLVYMFEGFQAIAERFPRRLVLPLKATAAAALLFAPAVNAFVVRPDPKDTLVTAPRYEELCAAVRRQTAPNALIIFWNPRVFALSTSRFASGWPAEGKPEEMIHYLHRVHPNYIVADKDRPDDRQFLIPVLAGESQMKTIYENDRFRLVQVAEDLSGRGPE